MLVRTAPSPAHSTPAVAALLIALVGCPSPDAKSDPPPPQVEAPTQPPASKLEDGWMVIVTGSKDAAEARRLFEEYKASGPAHGSFPQLLESAKVEGLNAGFHIVVAGIPAEKTVAEAMSAALSPRWDGTYVRAVKMPGVEHTTCEGDPRCVPQEPLNELQVLGLDPDDGTALNGNRVYMDGDPRGPTTDWKRVEKLTSLPGQPDLYEVYGGGGEGDCRISMLQFEVDGVPRSRLFFESYCFGDTSEVSTTAKPDKAPRFVLRTTIDGLQNPTMNADGFWEGTPFHEESTIGYSWRDHSLHRESPGPARETK